MEIGKAILMSRRREEECRKKKENGSLIFLNYFLFNECLNFLKKKLKKKKRKGLSKASRNGILGWSNSLLSI